MSSEQNRRREQEKREDSINYGEENELSNKKKNVNRQSFKSYENNEEIDSEDYKDFEKDKVKEDKDFTNPSLKGFRTFLGIVFIALFIFSMATTGVPKENIKGNLTTGLIKNVNAGEVLSKEHVKLDAKDLSINAGDSYGNIELSIWNFEDDEDGDYVQVFVNGSPKTEPFQIMHRPTKVSVPDKGLIVVKGIRDGSNNGITYGVCFSKTGETYLNKVPLNATNTYTIQTAK